MDYNDVKNLTQRRLNAGVALEQKNLDRIQNLEDFQKTGMYDHWNECLEMIFKLKTELTVYITDNGLVDGLIWDGQLQPVRDSKIIITSDMIQMVTDRFGYLREAEAITIINQILTDGHYVQDENYVHTDNNLTDDLLEKLESLPPTAEENLVNDVTFNGESIVVGKVAELVITPEDIKTWYESNPDTNALTDALLAIINSVPGFQETVNDRLDTIDEEIRDLDRVVTENAEAAKKYTDDTAADIRSEFAAADAELKADYTAKDTATNNRITQLETDIESELTALETKVDYNKGESDQRYTEVVRHLNVHDEQIDTFEQKIKDIDDKTITAVTRDVVESGVRYTLKSKDGGLIHEDIFVYDTEEIRNGQIERVDSRLTGDESGTIYSLIRVDGTTLEKEITVPAARHYADLVEKTSDTDGATDIYTIVMSDGVKLNASIVTPSQATIDALSENIETATSKNVSHVEYEPGGQQDRYLIIRNDGTEVREAIYTPSDSRITGIENSINTSNQAYGIASISLVSTDAADTYTFRRPNGDAVVPPIAVSKEYTPLNLTIDNPLETEEVNP